MHRFCKSKSKHRPLLLLSLLKVSRLEGVSVTCCLGNAASQELAYTADWEKSGEDANPGAFASCTNIKFTIFIILSVQFSSVKYTHIVVQPISRTLILQTFFIFLYGYLFACLTLPIRPKVHENKAVLLTFYQTVYYNQ